ncbi:batten's disease protein Cln3 [Rhizodiscina lignyota]|uniref:Protein BTN n=1 Tax=Rhizodiscina lignyota TaxID=1504668 RepID=A0A9P4ICS2_9PEZI|nr:batten's disease protein Cln3 [Rhizodiscina lignyota]
MLPWPGSASASWDIYRRRVKSTFEGADPRVFVAFWLFGLINNVLYVIILSAALDLVGPSVPKGVVLLANVLPGFLTKLIAPYFIQNVAYSIRILVVVAGSICGMFIIVYTPDSHDGGAITAKMLAIALASFASGGGELSFLALTHYYGHFSLAAWGSGTGGAGLIGAGAYVLATTTLGLSVHFTLLLSAFFPVIMLWSFFVVLPREPLKQFGTPGGAYGAVRDDDSEDGDATEGLLSTEDLIDERDGPLSASVISVSGRSFTSVGSSAQGFWDRFKGNLIRSRGLFVPYMIPLLFVYISEYTINQGVAPTLLFPLSKTPFKAYREFYPAYNAIYQFGVFISRSSTPFFRIHRLYTPSILQLLNLILLTLHAVFNFLPNVWIVFMIVFWEGLLGGLVYVSTFAEITDNVPKEDREFSLSVTTVSDSGGICIASFLGMILEVLLCNYQVEHGRDYCKKL